MAKPFKKLVGKMSPEAQARIKARTEALLLEMNLNELRRRCTELTQADVAKLLDVTQALVSKFERRDDVLVSSLYAYIEALGGELELRAKFPGHEDVRVTQFEHLSKLHDAAAAVQREGQRRRRAG